MQKTSVFKSQEGREKIRGYYDMILNAFPLGKRYVETTFGRTFILEAGKSDRPPMVLLHGSCSNNAAWLGDLSALSRSIMPLLSIFPRAGQQRGVSAESAIDEYSRWLAEVLDALALKKAILVGNSLGDGWHCNSPLLILSGYRHSSSWQQRAWYHSQAGVY
jgi:pimeloyl-ACP methyl ester carboxylesterase